MYNTIADHQVAELCVGSVVEGEEVRVWAVRVMREVIENCSEAQLVQKCGQWRSVIVSALQVRTTESTKLTHSHKHTHLILYKHHTHIKFFTQHHTFNSSHNITHLILDKHHTHTHLTPPHIHRSAQGRLL